MKENLFRKRVAAAYIDQSFTSFIPLVYFIYYFLKGIQEKWTINEYFNLLLICIILNVIVYVIYHTIFEMSKLEGSIGKDICGLKVCYLGKKEMRVSTSILRNSISCITTTLLIGYVFPLFNRERKTIQDICTKTRVVSKETEDCKE
ncbi:RDD family protein [Bacillus toyonensis]|uniref:RDD family protein n=1 Tax=Bacillus toyonensis TaxID=155322 RepID=UPI002E1F53CC|nr:RDD family protein [Bacillus toyonensis]